MEELLGEFLAETEENLEHLDDALLRFEREPSNRDVIDRIFRLVHTIKGTCGFLALERLAKIAHAAETLMGQYRDGVAPSVEGVTLILASLDRIKLILDGLAEQGREPDGDDADLIVALEALSGREPVEARGMLPVQPVSEQAAVADVPPVAEAESVAPPVAKPVLQQPAPMQSEIASEDAVADIVQSVRVKVETLEHLMATVSELVLTRNQLLDIARRSADAAFKAPLHRLSTITGELQRGIMKARMLPVSKAWQKLPRLVRDLSLELDKPIEFTTEGGDAELDRQVLEFIRDPLTHLVRNAADHGIETAQERVAAGKPAAGHIRLKAYAEGGQIVIEISDDGRGLDLARVRAKVAERSLATDAELGRMADADLQQFIFKPGFSTAAEVTAISGRGVGLDVVRSNVELIGGTVELKSTSPQGSVFSLRVPLTLAIVAALVVQSEGTQFAIPQHTVVEVVRCKRHSDYHIEMINEAPQLRLRGKLVPVFELSHLLRLTETEDHGHLLTGMPMVVVLEMGSRVFGLVVDDVLRAEDIVVKPKSGLLREVTMFSGNTILGDGRVIMIVDVNALAAAAGVEEVHGEAPADAAAGPEDQEEQPLPLLLFYAGSKSKRAVPLSLVTRLEEIPVSEIEHGKDGDVVRYRGGLMPLVFIEGVRPRTGDGLQPVLVFTDAGRHIGVAIDEIVDVVEEPVSIEIRSTSPGMIGSALVQDEVVEVVDISHYLGAALAQRLTVRDGNLARAVKVLLVDDSQFFRNMLAPLLSANGYEVTLAASAHEAMQLLDEGDTADLIISDLEMPGLDGIGFAEQLKRDRRWSSIPMIALSSHTSPRLVARSRAAGFVDYVGKFDRQKLMDALESCCSHWGVAA